MCIACRLHAAASDCLRAYLQSIVTTNLYHAVYNNAIGVWQEGQPDQGATVIVDHVAEAVNWILRQNGILKEKRAKSSSGLSSRYLQVKSGFCFCILARGVAITARRTTLG